MTFVVSTRIDDAAGVASLRALRGMVPTLRFKLDPVPSWDGELLAELVSLAAVDVVDMKGLYRNATVAMEPEPELYRRVFEALHEAWIEDPAVTNDTAELLDRTATGSRGTCRSGRSATSRPCRGRPAT